MTWFHESFDHVRSLDQLTCSAWALDKLFVFIKPWIVDSKPWGFLRFSIAKACLGPNTIFKLVVLAVLCVGSPFKEKALEPTATRMRRVIIEARAIVNMFSRYGIKVCMWIQASETEEFELFFSLVGELFIHSSHRRWLRHLYLSSGWYDTYYQVQWGQAPNGQR